ncbi:23 kDa integral membrane protein-like isoform X1 [Xiphophorus maculatus]|uniref:23 kDa integral membrane protein-like n=1 Tax=Xiphophorus maculatus TaxID=8083 RepID=A0A3B5QNA7_XIPMA|nr:23 kDa integral membrane protein-like isoform X1 [Xiphophorus maculatus]
MGKIDGCLKAVFISFNCLFACLGGILIYVLIRFSPSDYEMEGIDAPSVIWLWVFAVITLLISLLGSHAARTENKCGLKLFAVLMGLGMVLMLVFGVAVVVLKKQEMENFRSPKVAQEFLKDNEKKQLLETLQEHLHCCGWSGVEDWGSDVPKSCRCTLSYEECKPNPQGSIGPSSVHSKSCGEIVGDYVEYAVKIGLCIIFGFAFVAMMGLIISANMINQISRHDRAGMSAFAMKAY